MLTLLALSLLLLWEENYGYAHDTHVSPKSKEQGAAAGAKEGLGPHGNWTADEMMAAQEVTSPPSNAGKGARAPVLAVRITGANGESNRHPGNGKLLPRNGGVNGRSSGSGETPGLDGANGGTSVGMGGLRRSVALAWRCIISDRRVLLLGMVQSLFEGGTYTFGEILFHQQAVVGFI